MNRGRRQESNVAAQNEAMIGAKREMLLPISGSTKGKAATKETAKPAAQGKAG